MSTASLVILVRRLLRNKAFSVLNILGLAIGVGASILIFLVIRWETSYDGYHARKDRVFRVVTTTLNRSNREVSETHAYAPISLGDVIGQEVPGVEKVAALQKYGAWQAHVGMTASGEEKIFLQSEICAAEPALFGMIDVNWLEGNAGSLKDPNMAVIARSVGDRWFGDWHKAIGRTVTMGSAHIPMTIAAVFRDMPANTDVPLEMVMSYATVRQQFPDWFSFPDRWHHPARHSELYVLLRSGQERRRVEGELAGIVHKYYNEGQASHKTFSQLGLQPIAEMHLDERFETFKGDALSKKVLWSLGAIGVFLLLVACINFINLSTVQSVNRSKEIGVRKVLGSNRWQIWRQLMLETAVITLVGMVLGCGLAQAALPWLQEVLGKPVTADWFHSPTLLLYLLLLSGGVVLLAGSYPAVILSGFNVIEAIKNRISTQTVGGLPVRRGLVLVQFVIAQLLIVGTIVIVLQMQYFRTRPMGFDQAAVAMLELPGNIKYIPRLPYLKQSLLEVPGVEAAGFSNEGPAGGEWWREQSFYFDRSPVAQDFKVAVQVAEPDFVRTMRIPLVAGTLPDTGRLEVLVNETLVRRVGMSSSSAMIGKAVAVGNASYLYTVTGVVRDYHYQSMREAIGPLVIQAEAGGYNFLVLRLRRDAGKETMAKVQKVFGGVYPDYLFDYRWLDERIAHLYATEETTASLVKVFAGLAIVISCIGLYGLVAFLAVQKMKEVGIRKVLGASVGSIVYLFSREFTVLTVLAFLISAPVGYTVMHRWLAGFYYHVSPGWDVFALTFVLSLVIAWGTVGWQAWRAARANPILALRSE